MEPQKSSRRDGQIRMDSAIRPAIRRQPAALPFCSICQTNIGSAEPSRNCTVCDLPFHAECWDENRGCATFGCAGAPKEEPIRVPSPGSARPQQAPATGIINVASDQSIDSQRNRADMQWFVIGIVAVALAFVPWVGWASTSLWSLCVIGTVNDAWSNPTRPDMPHKEFLAFAIATCVMGWFVRLVLIPNL